MTRAKLSTKPKRSYTVEMASNNYKGVVSATFEKEWEDRDKGQTIVLHSFQIEGEKRYFRTGTKRPGFSEGTPIRFTADAKTNNVDFNSIETIDESEVERAPKPPTSSGRARSSARPTGNSRNDYWENKATRDIEVTEPRISYSAAQKNATELVCASLANDALSFGNAAKGKRLDLMVDYVEQLTLRLALAQTNAPQLLEEYRAQVEG